MSKSVVFPYTFVQVVRKSLGEVISLYFLPITLLKPQSKVHNVIHIFKTFKEKKRIKATPNYKKYYPRFSFTLTEAMITMAIIGVMSSIFIPNFISFRGKSRIAAIVATGEGIRAAFASFVSSEHHVPKEADVLRDISALSYCL